MMVIERGHNICIEGERNGKGEDTKGKGHDGLSCSGSLSFYFFSFIFYFFFIFFNITLGVEGVRRT